MLFSLALASPCQWHYVAWSLTLGLYIHHAICTWHTAHSFFALKAFADGTITLQADQSEVPYSFTPLPKVQGSSRKRGQKEHKSRRWWMTTSNSSLQTQREEALHVSTQTVWRHTEAYVSSSWTKIPACTGSYYLTPLAGELLAFESCQVTVGFL